MTLMAFIRSFSRLAMYLSVENELMSTSVPEVQKQSHAPMAAE